MHDPIQNNTPNHDDGGGHFNFSPTLRELLNDISDKHPNLQKLSGLQLRARIISKGDQLAALARDCMESEDAGDNF